MCKSKALLRLLAATLGMIVVVSPPGMPATLAINTLVLYSYSYLVLRLKRLTVPSTRYVGSISYQRRSNRENVCVLVTYSTSAALQGYA